MRTDIWHDVIDSLDLAVCAVDRDLRVILCNRTWDVLAHTTQRPDLQSDQLLGRSFLDTLGDFDRQRWTGKQIAATVGVSPATVTPRARHLFGSSQ